MREAFSDLSDHSKILSLTAGKVMLIGYPGSDYAGQLSLVTHVDHKERYVSHVCINGPRISTLAKVMKRSFDLEVDPANDAPIHEGGPHHHKELVSITNLQWKGDKGCSIAIGEYRMHGNEDVPLSIATGEGPDSVYLFTGYQQSSFDVLFDAIRYDLLGVMPTDPAFVYSAETGDTLWKRAFSQHMNGQPHSFSIPADTWVPNLSHTSHSYNPHGIHPN